MVDPLIAFTINSAAHSNEVIFIIHACVKAGTVIIIDILGAGRMLCVLFDVMMGLVEKADEDNVAVMPGGSFGGMAKNLIRVSLGHDKNLIRKACRHVCNLSTRLVVNSNQGQSI